MDAKVHGKNENKHNLPSVSAVTYSTRAYPTPQARHNLTTNKQPPAELEPSKVPVAVSFDVGRPTHGHLLVEGSRGICKGLYAFPWRHVVSFVGLDKSGEVILGCA
jgi:hypothetical protein